MFWWNLSPAWIVWTFPRSVNRCLILLWDDATESWKRYQLEVWRSSRVSHVWQESYPRGKKWNKEFRTKKRPGGGGPFISSFLCRIESRWDHKNLYKKERVCFWICSVEEMISICFPWKNLSILWNNDVFQTNRFKQKHQHFSLFTVKLSKPFFLRQLTGISCGGHLGLDRTRNPNYKWSF